MATKTERRHTAGFISSEANGNRSRAVVTVKASALSSGLASGTIMGTLSGGGYGAYDNSDPAAAAGILIEELDASSADVSATLIVRDAEVNTDELTGSDANGKTDLEALGIVYR